MNGTPFDSTEAVAQFDLALTSGDEGAAIAVVERLLDDGADLVSVLNDVIGATQREVGRRWQHGTWSVAQEHVATSTATAATAVVARYAGRVPVTRGHVVFACAEREWHVLPAMIVGNSLRADGWEVTQLGASTSPMRVSQYLHDLGPDAALVSCSVLGALPTTRRFIEAGTALGIPVVVGGAAFGWDDVRARALGATAWAAGPRQCIAELATLPAVVPTAPRLPARPAAEQAALELSHSRLADELRHAWPIPESLGPVVADVVHQALHAVSAALITGDPRLLPEAAAWITEVIVARGAPATSVPELGRVLTTVLREYPLACDLLERHWPAGPPSAAEGAYG